mmetsp:Transcript_33120/g.84079  ORF Transcript_33120/g.84079 Transcript_33120/m.84079 type:complete len:215 (-) Transcript_33120:4140-4784(-)
MRQYRAARRGGCGALYCLGQGLPCQARQCGSSQASTVHSLAPGGACSPWWKVAESWARCLRRRPATTRALPPCTPSTWRPLRCLGLPRRCCLDPPCIATTTPLRVAPPCVPRAWCCTVPPTTPWRLWLCRGWRWTMTMARTPTPLPALTATMAATATRPRCTTRTTPTWRRRGSARARSGGVRAGRRPRRAPRPPRRCRWDTTRARWMRMLRCL